MPNHDAVEARSPLLQVLPARETESSRVCGESLSGDAASCGRVRAESASPFVSNPNVAAWIAATGSVPQQRQEIRAPP